MSADKDKASPAFEQPIGKGDDDLGRIGLGTVQFGADYGISNELGQCTPEETRDILKEARQLGIRVLDTAPAYGRAEEALGRFADKDHFQIVTKTEPISEPAVTEQQVAQVKEVFVNSLRRVGRESVYAILVHHAGDLLKPGGDQLWTTLRDFRADGLVSKVGVSIYDGAQIDDVLSRFDVDLVQLPVNVFDQRLIRSGHLKTLRDKGIEIHARSIFLQGLLLMTPDQIPAHFEPVMPRVRRYHEVLKEQSVSLPVAALNFVRQLAEIDVILLGVNSVEHLREDVKAYRESCSLDYAEFSLEDRAMLDPQEWPAR
jgi:aryl-alcohol dehydrogenase-like predicted oxidoreductase